MGRDRVGERVDEARGRQRVESVLPPQTEDPQRPGRALDAGFDPAHQPVAEQDRQDVVAPASLRGRDVDLPDVVEVEQRAQQVAVPDQWIEGRQEGDAVARRLPGLDRTGGFLQDGDLCPKDIARTANALDLDRDERSGLDQLVSAPIAVLRRGRGAQPDLGLATGRAEQPVGPISGQELVATLLFLGSALRQQSGREEPLRKVVHATVPLPSCQAQDSRLREGLEDGAHLVRRSPVPLDGGARFHVGR
jgi:hypothetical protein